MTIPITTLFFIRTKYDVQPEKVFKFKKNAEKYMNENKKLGVKGRFLEEIKITGTLDDIEKKVKEANFTKTAMIIVGHALNKSGTASKLYDSKFSHGYRKGQDK